MRHPIFLFLLCSLFVFFLLWPLSAVAQMGASPGSLYMAGGTLADPTRDLRASQVDDVITIVVSESLSAVASGVTNSSRKSSAVSNITAVAGTVSATARLANPLNVSGDQELAGTGQTSRTMALTTTISARVVSVTPNGTLVVEGTRDIAVNSEKQSITVRGLVRPVDLTTFNTIASTQVADLQIKVNGKGVVGDAIRRPNVLYRFLLGLLPF
jgi:flagellar L-ring protein precursor FlgH